MNSTEQNEVFEEKYEVLIKFNKLIDIGKQEGTDLQQNKFKCLMDTPYEYYKDLSNSDLKPIRQSNTTSTESLRGFVTGVFKHYDVNPSKEG